jgi:hypothetical protein
MNTQEKIDFLKDAIKSLEIRITKNELICLSQSLIDQDKKRLELMKLNLVNLQNDEA